MSKPKEVKMLTKEALIAKLNEWFETVADYGEEEDNQAYQQLKEIVKEHFRLKDFTKGYEIIQIQEKPQVTGLELIKAEVEEIACELRGMMLEDDITDELIHWLKSKGVEVVDK